jgi:hypothetical protein
LVVIAAFESPAVVSGLDDVTVMGQPVSGMDTVRDRLGAGRLDGRQTVGQHRVEDVDHLPIAIVGAGEPARDPLD